jgi:CheY-like chemotaxis protein
MTDNLPLAYFLYNRDYEVIDCNRAAVNIFARDKGKSFELVRTYLISHARYIYPNYEFDKEFTEQVIRESCKQALEEGVFRFEHTYLTLSGEVIPCDVTIIPVRLDDGQGYIHYLRDLNDNQRIQAEIRRREAAEEENRAKSRFLARMSHEIRTPMHAVLGITKLLMQKENLPTDIYDDLSRINSSSELLIATLDDILDLSKVEAGKLEIVNASYDTERLISDTVQLNQIHSKNKNLSFRVTVDKDIPCRLIGDELRIKQILNNLLSNAFKYTHTGSVAFSVKIHINENNEPCICFTIRDTGVGLTAEQKNSLLDAEYIRYNILNERETVGTGLGMNVVKQLITLMSGKIQIDSELYKGTEITVSIPQEVNETKTLGAQKVKKLQGDNGSSPLRGLHISAIQPKPIDRSPMPYGRVLVVDDVESNVYVAQGILEHYDIGVDTANNGKEALERIKNGAEYDIIFMDLMMPEMDGEEATQKIRDLGYTKPIIALTANIIGKNEQMFIEKGYDGFIGKPINIDHMERYLTRFIREKYTAQSTNKPVILAIDDNPSALNTLNEILKTSYRVLSTKNGKTGLSILDKQKVDLILLDIAMPGLSGFDVLKYLKEKSIDIPVIIVTASDQPKDQITGMVLGAVDFLRKPFDKETVLRRIRLHLGTGRA